MGVPAALPIAVTTSRRCYGYQLASRTSSHPTPSLRAGPGWAGAATALAIVEPKPADGSAAARAAKPSRRGRGLPKGHNHPSLAGGPTYPGSLPSDQLMRLMPALVPL